MAGQPLSPPKADPLLSLQGFTPMTVPDLLRGAVFVSETGVRALSPSGDHPGLGHGSQSQCGREKQFQMLSKETAGVVTSE